MTYFDIFLINLGYFTIFSFVISILGGIMIAYTREKKQNKNSPRLKRIGIILFAQIFLVFFILFSLHAVFNRIIRNDIIETLNSKDLVIKINEKKVNTIDKVQIIKDLKDYSIKTPSHSGNIGRIYKIEMKTNNKSKKIYLQRNNLDTTIFYVWDYKYKTSTINDIGIIRTSILERY